MAFGQKKSNNKIDPDPSFAIGYAEAYNKVKSIIDLKIDDKSEIEKRAVLLYQIKEECSDERIVQLPDEETAAALGYRDAEIMKKVFLKDMILKNLKTCS